MNGFEEQIAAASRAKRDLHKEEMTRFGKELTWLYDPGEIPEAAVGGDGTVTDQCKKLAFWMLDRIGAWSQQGFHKLHVKEALEKHAVSLANAADIFEAFQENPQAAYGPGVMAMAEIHAVVPSVGKSHSIGREMWGPMARCASGLGSSYAREGTYAQMIVRDYMTLGRAFTRGDVLAALTSPMKEYNPAKFKPDMETGITTVTPIDRLGNTAVNIVASHGMNIGPGGCIAIQTGSLDFGCPNMFEAFWAAYSSAAGRLIYDGADEAVIPVVTQEEPEANYSKSLQEIFSVHRAFMAMQVGT